MPLCAYAVGFDKSSDIWHENFMVIKFYGLLPLNYLDQKLMDSKPSYMHDVMATDKYLCTLWILIYDSAINRKTIKLNSM